MSKSTYTLTELRREVAEAKRAVRERTRAEFGARSDYRGARVTFGEWAITIVNGACYATLSVPYTVRRADGAVALTGQHNTAI